MNNNSTELSISDLRRSLKNGEIANIGEEFFIATSSISPKDFADHFSALEHPCRFDGYMLIYCISGHFQIDINLTTFEIRPNSIILYVPGNLIRFPESQISTMEDSKFAIMAVTKDVISDVRLDFGRIYNESLSILDNPCIQAAAGDYEVLSNYHNLSVSLAKRKHTDPGVLRSLMSSIFYYIGSLWTEKLEEARSAMEQEYSSGDKRNARAKLLFEKFIKLVTEYHCEERCVGFYADKLCLTPKYLSKVIKSVSGRSAPDWIDSFVVLEAKNLLKYSSVSIKEIVYRLHFPSQSVFYKFFKAHTGLTPSQYRNS